MLTLSHTVEYDDVAEPHTVYLIADTHLGSIHTNEKLIRQVIDRIAADPRALWVHLGDVCEYISRRDPRHDEGEYAKWLWGAHDVAAEQRRYAIEMFRPIGDKLVAACEGNHETAIYQHSDREVYKAWAEGMVGDTRRVCLGHAGFVQVRYQRHFPGCRGSTFTLGMYLSHGSGGGRTPSSSALRLRDMGATVEGADVVAMGHQHKAAVLHQRKRRPGKSRAQDVLIWWLSVPSFIQGAKYAEAMDLPPQSIGWGEVIVVPGQRRVKAQNEVR